VHNVLVLSGVPAELFKHCFAQSGCWWRWGLHVFLHHSATNTSFICRSQLDEPAHSAFINYISSTHKASSSV